MDHNLPTRGPTRPPTHAAWVTYRPAIAPAASTSTPMSTPPGWARSSRCRPCTARPTDHGRCRLRADVLGFTRAGPRTDDAGRGLRAHPTGRAVTATWERLTSSSVITIFAITPDRPGVSRTSWTRAAGRRPPRQVRTTSSAHSRPAATLGGRDCRYSTEVLRNPLTQTCRSEP